MTNILTLLSLLGYGVGLRLLRGRDTGLSAYAAVCAVCALLYALALAGWLAAGAAVLFWGGLAIGSLAAVAAVRRGRRQLFEVFFAPEIVIWTILCLAYLLKFHAATATQWDEFSHWMKVAKAMVLTDRLPAPADAYLQFKSYPPGAVLIQYLFARGSAFREGDVYFGNFVLLTCPLLILMNGTHWRTVYRELASIGMCAFLFITLGGDLLSVYVDTTLGMHFGLLALAAMSRRVRAGDVILLAPALFTLTLVKRTGYELASVVVGLLLVNTALQHKLWIPELRRLLARRDGGRDPSADGRRNSRAMPAVLTAACFLVVAISPYLAHWSWSSRAEALGYSDKFDYEKTTLADLRFALSSDATETQKEVRTRFSDALTSAPLSDLHPSRLVARLAGRRPGHFRCCSAVRWAALVAACALACSALALRSGGVLWGVRTCGGFAIVLLGYVGYLGGMLVNYLFCFGPYEALRLVSFTRYANTYVLAMGLFSVGMCAREYWAWQGGRKSVLWRRLGIVAPWLAVWFAWQLTLNAPQVKSLSRPLPTSPIRNEVKEKVRVVKEQLSADARLFLIVQNDQGLVARVLEHELLPMSCYQRIWSLGEPYYEDDVWTNQLSPDQWSQKLREERCQFLLVARADQRFWRDYGCLFAEGSPGDEFLFRIGFREDGRALFTPVRSE